MQSLTVKRILILLFFPLHFFINTAVCEDGATGGTSEGAGNKKPVLLLTDDRWADPEEIRKILGADTLPGRAGEDLVRKKADLIERLTERRRSGLLDSAIEAVLDTIEREMKKPPPGRTNGDWALQAMSLLMPQLARNKPEHLKRIGQIARTHQDNKIRYSAFLSLEYGNAGHADWLAPLLMGIIKTDSDDVVRSRAMLALGTLSHPNNGAFSKYHDGMITFLRDEALSGEQTGETRLAAARGLKAMPVHDPFVIETNVEVIKAFLRDSNADLSSFGFR